MTEDELVEARKEIVLQGELLRKYREKYLDKPLATTQEKESLYRENFYKEIDGTYLEANHSLNCGLPLFSFPTDSYPKSFSDLLQNHMSPSHTIKAHAQEV